MKSKLKIIIVLTGFLNFSVYTSQPNTPIKATGRRTPMTPLSPLQKLFSSFRLTPQPTWQEEIAGHMPPGFLCTSETANKCHIVGKFQVDARTWQVLGNVAEYLQTKHSWKPVIQDWIVEIEIERLENGYELTITNPNLSYFESENKPLKVGQIWKCTTSNLLKKITDLLFFLDPRSPTYSE